MEKTNSQPSIKLFSLYWEIKTILYLGTLLLSSGLAILIYKNIDTIGHQIILLFIAAICIGSFSYCFKNKLPFKTSKVLPPNSFFDYILLLGCFTLVTFIGYLQFQYDVFGNRYGLATFLPMLLLFFTAYYFDHIGILCMAITALAGWAGIAVTPLTILQKNDFNSGSIIFTAFVLALVLLAAGYFSVKRHVKNHFEFTYNNLGTHLLFISTLAAMFHFEKIYLLFFLLLAGVSFFYYKIALKKRSFYFLLVFSLYFYIGLSYTIINLLFFELNTDMSGIYLSCIYFIASAIGLIMFLISMNKKLKLL